MHLFFNWSCLFFTLSSFYFINFWLTPKKEQSVKQTISPGEMETKMCLSHRTLWNCKELVGHVKESVIYIDEEVLCKFCEVYFAYKCIYVVNQFNHDSASEIKIVCNFLLDIINFMKVHVFVLLHTNPKPHDIIKHMCLKAIAKFQNYLVAVNFLQQGNVQEKCIESMLTNWSCLCCFSLF